MALGWYNLVIIVEALIERLLVEFVSIILRYTLTSTVVVAAAVVESGIAMVVLGYY